MSKLDPVRLIALYFPQFHPIPENDLWWGRGFTDWTNVRKAQPLFAGHYQPRVPRGGRYYDQSELDTLRWQVELARAHGVYGFCHYHYWFDGKQLLESPTNTMLSHPEIDFPFCLAWANETWSRRWDGREDQILIKQTYPAHPEAWEAHFQYLIRAWSDGRAIKIDGKPVFMIYRPHLVIKLGEMLAYWRKRAQESGLPGVFFVAIKQGEYAKPELLKYFDGAMHFQPFEAMDSPDYKVLEPANGDADPQSSPDPTNAAPAPEPSRPGPLRRLWKRVPHRLRYTLHKAKWALYFALIRYPAKAFWMLSESAQDRLLTLRNKWLPSPSQVVWDYDSAWNQIIKVERDHGVVTFPGAFVDWDNTPRYGKRARLFKGASPERFRYWFTKLVAATATRPPNERYIILNAWNEWAEGTYLEPDERYGTQYIEAVRDVLAGQFSADGVRPDETLANTAQTTAPTR